MSETLPDEMMALRADPPGGPEALKPHRLPLPVLEEGEVLIRVAAAGVNRPDLNQRRGAYPPPKGITDVLGLEVAGRIVATKGDVGSLDLGQDVCALVAGGGYAEYCKAPAPQVLPVPQGLGLVEAACLPETTFTVWGNLFDRGRLAAGESVLIHGGASGIGTTAIQLAKAFGARVFATAGTEEKCAACRDLGAERAINYRNETFADVVLEATEGRGVDAILDMVCAPYLKENLRCLAPDGRLIVMAFLGGGKGEVDVEAMVRRRQTLTGTTLRPQSVAQKGRLARQIQENVWPKIAAGAYRPQIHKRFPLADGAAAHAELEAGNHVGKIVLTME